MSAAFRWGLRSASERAGPPGAANRLPASWPGAGAAGHRPCQCPRSGRDDVEPELEIVERTEYLVQLGLIAADFHIALGQRVLQRGLLQHDEIGRASCRERVCQYV